ncbi:hypothetical protein QTJ16_001048 [Diplocarpon rosae]|uniref:Polyprenal reductase n=1 Tax=Diplocarpon rosae TaxID=946125 RepID=A0AAD9WH78_9HELO|nr:hypothetical protein QTJ16_001048 [Diplocarpon rosae]
MDPSLLCKTFFLLGTAVDIGGTLNPSFREQIMNYGSRGTTPSTTAKEQKKQPLSLFKYVASIQVPHTWFAHYYVVSVLSSIFWGYQIYNRGSAFKLLATYAQPKPTTMSVNQVILAWALMAFQGSRRLYECITLTRPSQSRMWAGLWLIGIAYYAVMGVSVWIEGVEILAREEPWESLLDIGRPSSKTSIAIPIFILASVAQYDCHVYLASLEKYTLPQRYLFRHILCPHYTSECLIYVAIAIVAAPQSQLFNMTVMTGVGFVASNLGVTADATKRWYAKKFGAERLVGRWRMVPGIY